MMKTLKIALIATLVAFTMVSLSYADGFKEMPKFKKVINLSVEKAIQNPGLVRAMYQQISMEEFLEANQETYVAMVYYQGNTYRISGTYTQWMRFFTMDGVPAGNTKSKMPIAQ
jgi:hypothetical protein